MYDILVEQGASKADCCHKIVQKYGIHYHILKEKTIPAKFFGIIPEKYELEYCLTSLKSFTGGLSDDTYPQTASPERQLRLAAREWSGPAESSGRDDSPIDFNEEKIRLIKAAGKNPEQVLKKAQDSKEIDQQQIIDKLNEIQKKIENTQRPEHPCLARITEMLRLNDFSERYTAGLLDRARKELPLETLENFEAVQDRFLEWIGDSIGIYRVFEKPKNSFGRAGRIMALIGPTGVGKTTTVAKLAAKYGIESPLSVRVITIDAFRIGAETQIKKFCEIMDIPFSFIDNHRDLRKEIDLYREETDLILVDTIGRSPKDSAKLGEMRELLDACGPKAEMHMVLSASTKTSDMEHMLRQFEPFNYQAVLLTKLDETRHVGNIISALAEKEKPLSYITDGQNVPKDIKKASVIRFLTNLEDFRVDRDELEKRFPAGEADQFQWG